MSNKARNRYCCKCGKELESVNERKAYLLFPRRWICNDCHASIILRCRARAHIFDMLRLFLSGSLLVSPFVLYAVSEMVFHRSGVSLAIAIAAMIVLSTIDKIFADKNEPREKGARAEGV